MHMRKKKWARPELAQCPYFQDFPEHLRGHWREMFAEDQPMEMELGCGKGVSSAHMVHDNPQTNFLCVDLSSDVLGECRRNLVACAGTEEIPNVQIVKCDIEYIHQFFAPEDRVRRIWISFCNPWTKNRRYEKRRLTHPRQLMQYRAFLEDKGEIWFKTDDDALFTDSMLYFDTCGFSCLYKTYDLHADGFEPNYITEHEMKFTSLGVPIKFAIFRKEEKVPDFDPVRWRPYALPHPEG